MSLIRSLLTSLFSGRKSKMTVSAPETENTNGSSMTTEKPENTSSRTSDIPHPDETSAEKASPDSHEEESNTEDRQIMPISQRRDNLIRCCAENLCETAADMPETGVCEPYRIGMRYPGTENICCISIEYSASDPSLRRIIAQALREGTDLAVSHYMEKGTKAEMLAWLKSNEGLAELRKSFDQLSDAVDDKW